MCWLTSCVFVVGYWPACPKITHITCLSESMYPVCVSYNQVCDYHNDCPEGDDELDCLAYIRCDFQTDMCGWMASNGTLYEWERYYNHSTYQNCITSRVISKPISRYK